MKNGAEILLECLLEHNVDTVFGYPGGAVLNIYDALYKYSDKIRHILTAHEQGASHAADGYARATGKTGVVFATSGPGATNLVTGLATAYMDSIPVVAITGNVANDLLGRDSFQEVDITGITTPITKHNFIVKDVNDLADTVRQAFKIAQSGRKGPVLIDIPKDVTAAKCEYHPQKPLTTEIRFDDFDSDIKSAVELIEKAKRPLLFLGGGVIASGASGEATAFARKRNIPVTMSLMGLGGFPSEDPLNLGMIGMHGSYHSNHSSHLCDLLIACGVRFSDRVAGNRKLFCPNAKIIHIDIDPSEFNKNVFADLTIHGDLKDILGKLTQQISPSSNSDWIDEIKSWKLKKPSKQNNDSLPKPRSVIKAVHKLFGDSIVVTDVGQHQMWVAQCYPFSYPRQLLTSGGLGTMGYGLGAAIGAQIACPQKRVVLFTGDGSFHMNMNELVTVSSYNLPIVIILMNNTVLGMVRQWQKRFYQSRFSATDPKRKTNYIKLAETFGICGMTIETEDDIEPVISKAYNLNKPVLIDCRISPDANVLPMIPPGGIATDMILEMD
ncbi:MAG TPA: biosynthetic-type acetolactate synthase large subunit [Clostridiales bacterium]|nr:biosynthetic-type acetolactate synthase large subunit [Clostridiales bacterium]